MKLSLLALLVLMSTQCFAQENNKYIVQLPKDYDLNKSYPLFIALHGGYDNMNAMSQEWTSKTLSQEFITVYMEASHQDQAPNRWGWRDVLKERKNIKNYYTELITKYPIDTNSIFMGGFSLGAKMSIDAAMSGYIPIKSVISVCHGGKLSDIVTLSNVNSTLERGTKFVIIYGENDTKYQSQSTDLINLMKNRNSQILTYEMKNQGHELPHDFERQMDKIWLPFITK